VSLNKIISLFGLSKGTLYYKKKGYPKNRSNKKIRRPKDVSTIKEVCKNRATYGVPRVKAITKRDFDLDISYYMVWKIMGENKLLIKKPNKSTDIRVHSGKIIVPKSNLRWASDITSIKLWNNTKARFTYVLDCCDRSIISWRLGFRMQASDIELMLQEAIHKRFNCLETKALGLEFLHDNGPEYIEKKFKKQMISWDVKNCNTPTYSPESNGMCEAFNGTFKRDYVYQSCLDNYETLRSQIGNWIEDYNTYAPHSGLGMKTPQEFFNLKMAA